MKYLLLTFLFASIVSCSGTKRIVESTKQKTVEAQEIEKDRVISNNDTIKVISHTNVLETKVEEEATKDILEFNQILKKRFIGMHELWDELLKKHVSSDGRVNYKSFKTEHKKLRDYIHVLGISKEKGALQSFSKEEKLAFWINAYNAMTVDLILRHYPIKSIKDIKDPWAQRLWKLGDKWYNLDDIEHQILRKMEEPRIHFAIVCASVSCPKLLNEAYTASNLESQLTNATKDFINDSERNAVSENDLEISKIFQWFTKDFKQDGSLIDFLNKYVDITISEKAKITFKDYNWDLNE